VDAGQKNASALARVTSATASTGSFRAAASAAPTAGRRAGSLAFPRWGTGARNGASVSTSSRSAGVRAAAARRSSAVLKETIPEYDSHVPRARARSASAGPPVKQWNTVRGGTPSDSRTANVSAQASREWMISGSPRSAARRSWARKASSWASGSEWR